MSTTTQVNGGVEVAMRALAALATKDPQEQTPGEIRSQEKPQERVSFILGPTFLRQIDYELANGEIVKIPAHVSFTGLGNKLRPHPSRWITIDNPLYNPNATAEEKVYNSRWITFLSEGEFLLKGRFQVFAHMNPHDGINGLFGSGPSALNGFWQYFNLPRAGNQQPGSNYSGRVSFKQTMDPTQISGPNVRAGGVPTEEDRKPVRISNSLADNGF